MKLNFCIILFFYLLWNQITFASANFSPAIIKKKYTLVKTHNTPLQAQNHILVADITRSNPYDPFADYTAFENTVDEQEAINFFQNGRFLTLGSLGGVQLFTWNMYSLYDIGPVYGGYINYFFDLVFAIQFSFISSNHSIKLKPFSGQATFNSLGIDFKYFAHPDLFHKNFSWLKLYGILGLLHTSSSVTGDASSLETQGFVKDDGYGVNIGVGTEMHFIKKIYFGIQYTYQYVTLTQEAQSLTSGTIQFKPFGDWMQISFLLGINF